MADAEPQIQSKNVSDQGQSDCERIGLFDSGVGGLSVLKQLQNVPRAGSTESREFFYVADTARCPYGNRERDEIALFVEQIVKFLSFRQVDALVMACNTSAALALDVARSVASVPVYDLITPTAKHVAGLGAKVGVMATMATAKSHAFKNAIQKFNPDCPVFELGCPDLVPIVEAGNLELPATLDVLENHIAKLVEQKVELLILGCTHFPFLRTQIETLLQGRMTVVDPAEVLAKTLSGNAPIKKLSNQKPHNYFVTGCPTSFSQVAQILLGELPGSVQGVLVEQLVQVAGPESIAGSESNTDIVVGSQVASPVVP